MAMNLQNKLLEFGGGATKQLLCQFAICLSHVLLGFCYRPKNPPYKHHKKKQVHCIVVLHSHHFNPLFSTDV